MSKYILNKENCGKIVGKVLVFQAEQDDYVDKGAQEIFTGQVKSARMVPMPGTKHEIYMSDDSSGLKGLGGIPAARGRIIRPLLAVRREEILDFLEK